MLHAAWAFVIHRPATLGIYTLANYIELSPLSSTIRGTFSTLSFTA